MRALAILGSTGSIGTQALDVVRHHADRFRVVALSAAGTSQDLLAGQIRGQELTCPAHGWRFDLRSGACVTAARKAASFTVTTTLTVTCLCSVSAAT